MSRLLASRQGVAPRRARRRRARRRPRHVANPRCPHGVARHAKQYPSPLTRARGIFFALFRLMSHMMCKTRRNQFYWGKLMSLKHVKTRNIPFHGGNMRATWARRMAAHMRTDTPIVSRYMREANPDLTNR